MHVEVVDDDTNEQIEREERAEHNEAHEVEIEQDAGFILGLFLKLFAKYK